MGRDDLSDIEQRLKAVRFELAEYRRKRELEAVEHLTPEERRQKIREWTRRIAGGGVIIAAFALAWDWLRRMLRQHPGPAVLAAAGTTMAGTALAFSLWGLPDGTVQGDVPGAAPAPSAPDSGPVAAPSPVDEATADATAPDLPDVEVDATVAPVDEGSAADTEDLAGSAVVPGTEVGDPTPRRPVSTPTSAPVPTQAPADPTEPTEPSEPSEPSAPPEPTDEPVPPDPPDEEPPEDPGDAEEWAHLLCAQLNLIIIELDTCINNLLGRR